MRPLLFILFLLTFNLCQAQEPAAVSMATYAEFNRQVHIGRDQSFLNVGSGIGNQESLLWEGQFATQYAIAHKSKPWALVFNPKTVIRMANEESYPLRPPSFHINAAYHRQLGTGAFGFDHSSAYLGIGHHSNGQAGVFFFPGDTIINTVNGNFAQNHVRIGYTLFSNEKPIDQSGHFKYLSLFAHITPPFSAEWSGVETLDRLGFYRPFLAFGMGGVSPDKQSGPLLGLRKNSNLMIKVGWIVGEMQAKEGNEAFKRGLIDAQYQYVLPFLKDIALSVRFFRGQDYYNIRFQNTLSVLSFGFSSNIGTIKAPISYVGKKVNP